MLQFYHLKYQNSMKQLSVYFGLCLLLFIAACSEKPKKGENNNNETNERDSVSALEQDLRNKGLVDIQSLDSTILVDLKYSTTDNFIQTDVYGDLENCYLKPLAAEKLIKAHEILKEMYPDYRFLVFDGVRPRRVQQIFWDSIDVPDDKKGYYVANPKSGSVHNFGFAVDLTIIDENGEPLDMGTEFDDFGERAYTNKEDSLVSVGKLTAEQVTNRLILRKAMTNAGFHIIKSEWWHFDAIPIKEVRENYQIIE